MRMIGARMLPPLHLVSTTWNQTWRIVSEALTHGADGVPHVVLAAVRRNAGERPVSWVRSANTLARPASRPWLVHVGIVIRRRVQAFSELQVCLNAIQADVLPRPRGLVLSRLAPLAGTVVTPLFPAGIGSIVHICAEAVEWLV